jgi:hypothetical protein
MINVKIGNEERRFDGNPQWVQEQLERRRREVENVGVRISIECGDIHMLLSTPGCPSSGGGGRPPNREESEILALWEKFKLNTSSFAVGNLIAFLKQVVRLC